MPVEAYHVSYEMIFTIHRKALGTTTCSLLPTGIEIRYTTDEEMPPMTAQELETVASYVQDHLPEWLERSSVMTSSDYFRLSERIVRVEEGLLRVEEALKNQNVLMDKRFEAVDKRFEDMNKRLEDMNKRFEDMNKRFEDMNKRFEDLIHLIDKRFEDLIHQMDKRFDAIDRRFGWMMGIMTTLITGLGVLITIYRFVGSAG